jgi:hypothetical protein
VAIVRKAAEEITRFLQFVGASNINESVLTGNKIRNFASLVTSGLGSDVARGPPF